MWQRVHAGYKSRTGGGASKVTGLLMGILSCHCPLTPGNQNTLVQSDINIAATTQQPPPLPQIKGDTGSAVMAGAAREGDGLKSLTPQLLRFQRGLCGTAPDENGASANRHMNDCLFCGPTQSPTE